MLDHRELLELKPWNTPTIYRGCEQITAKNPATAAVGAVVGVDVPISLQSNQRK
jgi:hypothetical protein